MSDGTREERADRLEALIQRQLDGELAPPERAELAALLANDPAARRRHEEYVALEGLLFAVATTERSAERPAPAAGAAPGAVPARRARTWLAPALAALLLALVVYSGIAAPRVPRAPLLPLPPAPIAACEPLRVTDLSEGHLAVALPSEHPDVQIVWLYLAEARPAPARSPERTP